MEETLENRATLFFEHQDCLPDMDVFHSMCVMGSDPVMTFSHRQSYYKINYKTNNIQNNNIIALSSDLIVKTTKKQNKTPQ